MKKVLAIILVLWTWHNWDAFFPQNYKHITEDQVTLYATTWCGYCKKAREYFAENEIPYVEIDIEKSAKGKREYDKLKKSGVPIIKIGEKVITGFNVNGIEQALKLL